MLLDTHIWLRWLSPGDSPLPPDVLEKLQADPDVAVSAVSCWEVAYLVKRGRLVLPLALTQWLREALAGSDVRCVPLDAAIAAAAADLSDIHRDPADRFIIATALVTGRPLLTLDGLIRTYPEVSKLIA